MEKVALIFYSRDHHTKHIAETITKELGIPKENVEEIVHKEKDPKASTFFDSWNQLFKNSNVPIAEVKLLKRLENKEFSSLIFGAPIYNGSIASEGRQFLGKLKGRLKEFGITNLFFYQSCSTAVMREGINSFKKCLGLIWDDFPHLRVAEYQSKKTKKREISKFIEQIKENVEKETYRKIENDLSMKSKVKMKIVHM